MNIVIHPITMENIASADPLLIQAYNADHSFQAELEFYLRLQPDGWFFVMNDTTPIGVGGVTNYGPFAYIGVCPQLEQCDPFTRNHDKWGMRGKAI